MSTYIDIRSGYFTMHGNFAETRAKLLAASHADVVALAINDYYNSFVRDYADYKEDDGDKPVDPTIANGLAHGKRVPYLGWYWRNTDWANKNISIGDCGKFIGFMENNKWNYPERDLTEAEADQVIVIIDAAIRASRAGGEIRKMIENTHRELERLWPLFQTFTI